MPLDRLGFVERYYKKLTKYFVKKIINVYWITPNLITIVAFILAGILTPILILKEQLILAAIVFLIGNFLDNLDGDLARARNMTSPEGAILDAVLDRYVDLFTLSAMILIKSNCLVWGMLAVVGSCLVPYIRARTEAEGKKSTQTLGSRDVRNFVIFLGLIFNQICLTLFIIGIISNISAIHRFIYALKNR